MKNLHLTLIVVGRARARRLRQQREHLGRRLRQRRRGDRRQQRRDRAGPAATGGATGAGGSKAHRRRDRNGRRRGDRRRDRDRRRAPPRAARPAPAATTGTGGKAGAPGTGGTSATGGTTGTGGKAGATGTGGTRRHRRRPLGTGGTDRHRRYHRTGGTTATGGTTGTGNAPGNASSVYPPVNGTNVCPDPQLRITFSGAPSIGTSGLIQVFNSGGTAVSTGRRRRQHVQHDQRRDDVQLSSGRSTSTATRWSSTCRRSRSPTARPTTSTSPRARSRRSGGAAFVVTGTTAWRFTTAAAAPTNKAAIGVALDGSAPFCSLQGALDFIPANNTAATTVSIANGTYHEIVYFKSKQNVSIQGASETGTILEGVNNNNLNPSTKGRALIGGDSTSGLTVNNLTIYNQTPQGGSQAEALRLESCSKCVVTNSTIISYQDTLLWDGTIYAKNDLIEGNVDYIWSSGAAYFDSCEIRTINRSGGVIVQSRNAAGAYGYVFNNCKLTSDSASTGIALARIDASAYPGSMVAYINCQMTNNIAPVGWTLTGGSATSSLRFWEYKSVTTSGDRGRRQQAAGRARRRSPTPRRRR